MHTQIEESVFNAASDLNSIRMNRAGNNKIDIPEKLCYPSNSIIWGGDSLVSLSNNS